jgi:hypothetical protein
MNCFGYELLACATFPGNEYRAGRICNAIDNFVNLYELRRLADYSCHAAGSRSEPQCNFQLLDIEVFLAFIGSRRRAHATGRRIHRLLG